MKCLVSGATGFIGRQLCQQLAAAGHTVVALSKSGAMLDSGQPTQVVDLSTCDFDGSLLQGVDVVFHLAGIAHQRAQEPAYTALNYRATMHLASLASGAGVRCFVFLSSVKAMGRAQTSHARVESECELPDNAYGLSKWQAECALREAFGSGAMSVAIVRPALVYGHEPKGNLHAFATGVRWGLPRPPPAGRRSMIALEDLVALLRVLAQHPVPGVQTWIACGNDGYSTQEIYDLLRASQGKRRAVQWVPHWLWRLGASLGDIVLGRSSGSTYDKLFGTELYSNAAVVEQTGWRPEMTLEDAMSQMAAARGRGA